MSWRNEAFGSRSHEKGQVLAEAVIVAMVLALLLTAVHLTGRWQFEWTGQWLKAQIAADSVALEHPSQPAGAAVSTVDFDEWRNWVFKEYSIGNERWHLISGNGSFGQEAWRLVGAGQVSHDKSVTTQIKHAKRLWGIRESASKAVVGTLMPAISAVELPWEDRGAYADWLSQWQGLTPSRYLQPGRR